MNKGTARIFSIILYITTAVLASSCAPTAAQKAKQHTTRDSVQQLSVQSMRDDLFILWSAIKEMHPAYGIYTPADSLQQVYNETLASINGPLSEMDFMSRVYPLLSRLRCGHTQLKHSPGYKGIREPRLPFEVLVRQHRAWITTHTTRALNTGDELLTLNGVPVATIIGHGADLYAGDGYNETFKELFLSEYDGFEDGCNHYYHWQPPYQVSLRTKQGQVKNLQLDTVVVPGLTAPEAPADTGWITAPGTDYLQLRFLKNKPTAWFQASTYQYNDTVIYKTVFKQIHEKGIQNLVLDLRHNTGGDLRIAAKLMSYLANAPYHMISNVQARIPNPAINHFEQYFDTSRTESFNQGFKPGKKEGAFYHIDFTPAFGNMLAALPLDAADHFNGRLFVLIDGATFSAGAHTATAIKAQCKNAIFIGRETAGASDGCSGGTVQHLTLPNTGIMVEFPWMRLLSVDKHATFGRGVLPDYEVVYGPQDVVEKKDLDIEKVLSLMN
jgi:hypothetical protein